MSQKQGMAQTTFRISHEFQAAIKQYVEESEWDSRSEMYRDLIAEEIGWESENGGLSENGD